MTNEIILSAGLEELLRWIAEATAALTEEGPHEAIAAVNRDHGDFLLIGEQRRQIQYSGLEELEAKGLVSYTERSGTGVPSGSTVAERVAITSDGLAYLERGQALPELSINLTQEQTDLLLLLVEETRHASGGQQLEFHLIRPISGDVIIIRGERSPVFYPDVRELAAKRLVNLTELEVNDSLVVTAEGFDFYEEVKRARGEAMTRVEDEVRHLLERHIIDSFEEGAQRWREAEDLLWDRDVEEHLTAIGHKCREALQAFAQTLYERHCPNGDSISSNRTVDKIRAVLLERRAVVGETTEGFLIAYWGTVSDLAQRAEHGSENEERPLVWEDARRLVFQTLLVMVELAAATRP